MILSDTERIKQIFDEQVKPEAFLAYLKDRGFSVFYPRDAHDCPLAQWLTHLFGLQVGVSHLSAEVYGKQDNLGIIPKIGSFLHSDGRPWMRHFVEQVDSVATTTIEGWKAAEIMENILRPYKSFVTPDGLSILRKLRLSKSKEKVYA